MTPTDWDDDRVAAAFRARFDRPAPRDLEFAIQGAVEATPQARRSWFRPVAAWTTLAAAVVLVAVGSAAVLGLGGFGRPSSGSTGPSDSARDSTAPSASVGAGATPTQQALPGSVFGLPIVHVTDAIAVRDASAANTEMAVQGWFTPAPPFMCGPAPTLNPLEPGCPRQLTTLTEEAESLIHVRGDTITTSLPVGPALNPLLDGVDTSWAPALPVMGTDGDSAPIDVVFIGHFGDRRATLCPEAEQAVCRTWFVVDSVAIVHGRPVPLNVLTSLTNTSPVSSVADIDSVIVNEAPQSPILWMAAVDGPVGLTRMEPSVAGGMAGLDRQPILWVARVLEGEFISTYIVIDGTDAIYEMNPNNEAVSVGGSPSGPSASPGPWPPTGATVVTLTSQVAAGAPPVQVAVVDGSGRLINVAEKGTLDPCPAPDGACELGVYTEPGKPGRVHLAWTGGICDSRITVTVADDLKTITFDMGPQPPCDSLGIVRQVVLDFSGSIDDATIDVVQTVPALTVEDPRVTINPATHLVDGKTVEVLVTGFGVGGKVFLSECSSAAEATDLGCGAELAAQTFLVTDDNRIGSSTFVVRATAAGRAPSGGPLAPCADQCVLVATIGGGYPFVATPLAFDAPN